MFRGGGDIGDHPPQPRIAVVAVRHLMPVEIERARRELDRQRQQLQVDELSQRFGMRERQRQDQIGAGDDIPRRRDMLAARDDPPLGAGFGQRGILGPSPAGRGEAMTCPAAR